MRDAEVALLLSTIPMFQGLSPGEAADLAHRTRTFHFVAGSILFLEGDPGDRAYVVIAGQVDLLLESLEGEQFLLHQVAEGEYFGEMALLDDRPRSATAMVSVEADVLAISRQDFVDYLGKNPQAALRMLRSTVHLLRLADEKIKMLGFLDVAGRLARSLLDLDQPAGKRTAISIRHEQLAAMIGSRRPTVTTLLGHWRDSGYIITGRGRLTVVDREALEELAAL